MPSPAVSPPTVSVIVVNWNGLHLLRPCLDALRAQTYTHIETVVVDNGSEDGSVGVLAAEYPDVRVVALAENAGFCGGNNRGIEAATGALVMLLNNDTEADPGCIAALVDAAARDPGAGSFACQMVRYHDRDRMDNAGIELTPIGRAVQIGAGAPRSAHGRERRIFGASGGAVLYRRTLLEATGGLDEAFFSHVEDVDLAWRAQLAGFACLYVPSAVVYHIGAASSQHVSEAVLYRIQRNTTWAFLKNMPGLLMPALLPAHLAYGAYWMLRAGRTGQAGVVWRAKRDALRAWPDLRARRRAVQQTRRVGWRDLPRALFGPHGS